MNRSKRTTGFLLLLAMLVLGTHPSCRRKKPPPSPQGAQTPADARPEFDASKKLLRQIASAEHRRDAVTIVPLIGHNNESVRQRATLAAGRIGSLRAFDALRQRLSDPVSSVRHQAAVSLRLLARFRSELQRRTATAVSRQMEKETDPAVRTQLLLSLGWVGTAADVGLLTKAPITVGSIMAWGHLARRLLTSERTLLLASLQARLVAYLGARAAPGQRQAAAWALTQFSPVALPEALINAAMQLDHHGEETQTRIFAIRALGASATRPQHFAWLKRQLLHPDPALQIAAARALVKHGARAAVRLAHVTASRWREIAANHYRLTGFPLHSVLVALGELERFASVPTVRRFAGQVLEAADGGPSVVRYKALESHSIDLVHCAAARLLDIGVGRPEHTPTCGTTRSAALSTAWRRRQVVAAIAAINRQAPWKLANLRRYLGDDHPSVRLAAVNALASISRESLVLLPLTQALQDPHPAVAAAAAKSFRLPGRDADRRALNRSLTERLSNWRGQDHAARCTLLSLLARLDPHRADLQARRLVSRPNLTLRACAAKLIRRAGNASTPAAGTAVAAAPEPEVKHSGQAVLVTDRGEVFLKLLTQQAPMTVARFVRLAFDGHYRASEFGPIEANQWLEAGPGLDRHKTAPDIPCELSEQPFEQGAVALALEGPDTGQSRLLFALARKPEWDERYTVFARVTAGMEILRRLQPGDRIKDLYIPKPRR